MDEPEPAAEQIVGVAVVTNGVICALPRPARHHHVIQALGRAEVKPTGHEVQGFVTDKGRFVGRYEARDIAALSGQIKSGEVKRPELFSEDVW